jgi:Asp-tRNA(Asn)/Glu-tRNA(Gln) amidotransferase A subunit family amidase
MPCGFDKNNMPIGAQIIGRPLGEADVLKTAHAFQLVTDFHRARPQEVK